MEFIDFKVTAERAPDFGITFNGHVPKNQLDGARDLIAGMVMGLRDAGFTVEAHIEHVSKEHIF